MRRSRVRTRASGYRPGMTRESPEDDTPDRIPPDEQDEARERDEEREEELRTEGQEPEPDDEAPSAG